MKGVTPVLPDGITGGASVVHFRQLIAEQLVKGMTKRERMYLEIRMRINAHWKFLWENRGSLPRQNVA